MAGQAADPTVGRIISHMNNDHQDSLVRYLEHYHGLSSFAARNARMTSMSLSHIGLASSASAPPDEYTIPLNPPLKSYIEARERVVGMDKDCIQALGRDELTITQFRRPNLFHTIMTGVCIVTFASFASEAGLLAIAEHWPVPSMRGGVAAFIAFCARVRVIVLYPMFAAHLIEAIIMDRTRLRKHSVPRGSAVWWKWVTSTFAGGFGNFQQFDALVRDEKAKLAAKKHS